MNQIKFTPLHNQVVIEPAPVEEAKGGIMIPDAVRERPAKGIIVAVAEGSTEEPMKVKVGDNVLHRKNAGVELLLEGKTYLIMTQRDIFGTI